MLKINKIYDSELISALMIDSAYETPYSEVDFNQHYSISFPVKSGFYYKTGRFRCFMDTNTVLFEPGQIEFEVSKIPLFTADKTLTIQFSDSEAASDFFPNFNRKTVTVKRRSPRLEHTIRNLAGAFEKIYQQQLTLAILDECSASGNDTDKMLKDPLHSLRMDNAKDFIFNNFAAEIGLDDISGAANISIFHFSRIFKRRTGYSPYDYLIRVRLEKAKQFLKSGMSVTDCAFNAGFNSINNFCYTFRAKEGISATAYQKSKISKIL